MKTFLTSLAVISALSGVALAGDDHGANFRDSFAPAATASSGQVEALVAPQADAATGFQLFVQQVETGERGGKH